MHQSGYKINVLGSGEGTRVSVSSCLMQGPYDDRLKWPYRREITIQIRGGCACVIDCITCAIELYACPCNPLNLLIQHFVKTAHWR